MDKVTEAEEVVSESNSRTMPKQSIQEFRATVIADITAMRDEIKELKKDTSEILAWFHEARSGLQFLYKIGNWIGTFVVWSAKVIAAAAVVWAAISAAKGIRIPDFGK